MKGSEAQAGSQTFKVKPAFATGVEDSADNPRFNPPARIPPYHPNGAAVQGATALSVWADHVDDTGLFSIDEDATGTEDIVDIPAMAQINFFDAQQGLVEDGNERPLVEVLVSGGDAPQDRIEVAPESGQLTSIDMGDFDGIWKDNVHFHVISGDTLTWSNRTVSMLQATERRDTLAMFFCGKLIEGTLFANGQQIGWNDGDVWTRMGHTGARLDGTWLDVNLYHVIQGEILQWSNKELAHLEVLDCDTVVMMFNGARVEGKLDPDGNALSWSDGYTWTRAGFDGVWQEGRSALRNSIEGETIRISSGQQEKCLKIVDRTTLELVVDGVTHQANLNPLGDRLIWSDGDIWTRIR